MDYPKSIDYIFPLRPIITSIGTFNYSTARLLAPIISPLTTGQYTIENSTTFVKDIASLTLQQPITVASFDVESLLTNVPLTRDNRYCIKNSVASFLDNFGLTKANFISQGIAVHHSVFTYDDLLYTQIDGVAMGSSLGPRLRIQFKFTFVFSNSNTTDNVFKQPVRYSTDLCSNVVYLLTCPSCQANYMGS